MPGAEHHHLALALSSGLAISERDGAISMVFRARDVVHRVLVDGWVFLGVAFGCAPGDRNGSTTARFATLKTISDSIHRVEVRDLRSRVASILAPGRNPGGDGGDRHAKQDAFVIGDIARSDLPIITMSWCQAWPQ